MPQDTWQKHQEWIRRQCASDWQQFEEQFEGDTPLHEALDLFYRVAQLPVDDPDLNGFWEQLLTAVEGYRQASDPDKRISCLRDLAVAAETCLKRIVKLAAPEAYATLGRPAEPGRPPREPMFTDLLDFPGLGLITDASRRIYRDFAWRARNIRNKLSHATPELSELEVARAFVDFWLTMLWATVKYKRELESLLFVLPRKSHLEKLLQRWQEHIRRWVLLDAEKLPADDESGLAELTAGELPAENAQDDLADEQEDETGKEDEEEAEERVASLPQLRRGKVHDLFEQVGRLILIADAGAGKTTSLQHYAYLQARSLLNNPRQFRPVPIYVELRYYRPEGGLWHLLRKALGSNGSQVDGGFEQFREEIAEGKWILLLDGLNEVQDDLQEQALRELEELIGEYPQARLVVTSRRDVPLERLKLPVFRVDPLTDDQIVDILKRHFSDERGAQTFARTLRRNPRLWDWGRNPLQLWMLVQVGLRARGGLPENRGQLLRLFVEYLLQREESKGPQTPRDIKLDLLSELGYQTRQAGRVSFPRLQAWQIVRQRCQEMGYGVDSARFVREVCDNHLLADQGEQLAFAHEMYQEYFAACGLKCRYEADPRVVEPLLGQGHWREPLVLLWGLLESPQTLFQRIVRDEPAVAAECLASAVQPKADEREQLRQRILHVDYRTASDKEPQKILEAIYILGDGSLLAYHLQERRRYNRLKDIGREVAEAFTGDEPALRATLDALEHLGKSANAFSQPLLQPLQTKDLKILAELQKKAVQLWHMWQDDYKAPPLDLLLLASAFQIQSHLADEIRRIIESWFKHGQWMVARLSIRFFGLPMEHFREAAAAGVRELLEQRQWQAALQGIKDFDLTSRFPPEPIVELALRQGQWEAALQGIQIFGLRLEQYRDSAAAGVQALLEQMRWQAALQGIKHFDLTSRFPPEPIVERVLQERQWQAALQGIKDFHLTSRFPPEPIVERALQERQWEAALQGIKDFHLTSRFPPEPIVERALQERQWEAALQGIKEFNLTSRFPPEPIIERALQQRQWRVALEGLRDFRSRLEYLREETAASLHRGGKDKEWLVAWLNESPQSHRRFRNGVATILLQRYSDVENALALVGSLGFNREQIEHNRAQIERVMKIKQVLSQTNALPGEALQELELFGYVSESRLTLPRGLKELQFFSQNYVVPYVILAPGIGELPLEKSARWQDHALRVVRFWLVVERHPADNRPVLNATNLVPV